MDSKLVVEQMSGRWKVKHPDLAELNAEARALAVAIRPGQLQWIPRAENSHADRLANEAMDAAAEQPAHAEKPPAVRRQLRRPAPPGWTGARGAATRLLLLRHGQTELSVQRRYSGRGNPPLTELGRQQADAAARYLAQPRRDRRGGQLTVAACLRHRDGGRQGAGPGRRRRRRPDRNRFRRMGRPDVQRGRRTRPRTASTVVARHQHRAAGRGKLRPRQRAGPPGAGPDRRRTRRRARCSWCRT